MIVEQHALWGEEPSAERPAMYTAYLADRVGAGSRNGRPAIIVCGGGGFTHIAEHEQEPVAFEFLNRGYQAFVLDYVTSETGDVSFPNPEADLACMVATVRANATAWHVDPQKVTVLGFSAGGFICASLATQWHDGPFAGIVGARPEDIRPNAAVLCYPVLDFAYLRAVKTRDPRIDLRVPKTGGKTGRDLLNDFLSMVVGGDATDERLVEVNPTTHVDHRVPPTFVWCAADDQTAPAAQVYPFGAKLAEAGVPHEFHVFAEGGHGLSLANANTLPDEVKDEAAFERRQRAVRPWAELAASFLARHGVA